MEEELIPLMESVIELAGLYAIIVVFAVASKYFNTIVTYYKDVKIAKLTGQVEPAQLITYMLEPRKTFSAKAWFTEWKEKRKQNKEDKEYGRVEQDKVYPMSFEKKV